MIGIMDICRKCRYICFIRRLRKRVYLCIFVLACFGYLAYYDFFRYQRTVNLDKAQINILNSTSFPLLLNALQNQYCIHPSLDPYHPSVVNFFHPVQKQKCQNEADWVSVSNGSAQIMPGATFKRGQIICRLVPILRGQTDDIIKYGKDTKLSQKEKVSVPSDFIKTSCKSKTGHRYMNIHSTIAIKKSIFNRLNNLKTKLQSETQLNVLMLGFDSVSRNTWLRMLPSAHSYFKNELQGIVLEGYNIVGDGTPQALLPILTGKTEEELPEARRGHQGATTVDSHPWIWKNFSRLGYVTQWGEDMAFIGTFNMRMMGFDKQPVDHYMRPFYLVTEKLHKFYKPYCLGSQPRHRIMFNYLKDFVNVYREHPKFSFLFHSEYSHDNSNTLQWMDQDLINLMKYMYENGHLNSTVLILMSDHGARFHDIRQTLQGKYEERMPYFAFRFPEWFAKKYHVEYNNLKKNSKRLVTPFDIHATFEHILSIAHSNLKSESHIKNTTGALKLPRGISILKDIPQNRSCYDAGIAPHWCACLPWKHNDINDIVVQKAAEKVVGLINSMTNPFRHKCRTLSIIRIIRAMTFTPSRDVVKFVGSSDKDGRYAKFDNSLNIPNNILQVTFHTSPGDAIYEATVVHDKTSGNFFVDNREISRTNTYGTSADCIESIAPHLRQYCYCTNI